MLDNETPAHDCVGIGYSWQRQHAFNIYFEWREFFENNCKYYQTIGTFIFENKNTSAE